MSPTLTRIGTNGQAFGHGGTAFGVAAYYPAQAVGPPPVMNLLVNGEFDQPATGNPNTGWNVQGTAFISGGALHVNGNNDSTQRTPLIPGDMYRLTGTLRSVGTGYVQVLTDSGANGQLSGAKDLKPGQLVTSIDFVAVTNGDLWYIRGQDNTDALFESLVLLKL